MCIRDRPSYCPHVVSMYSHVAADEATSPLKYSTTLSPPLCIALPAVPAEICFIVFLRLLSSCRELCLFAACTCGLGPSVSAIRYFMSKLDTQIHMLQVNKIILIIMKLVIPWPLATQKEPLGSKLLVNGNLSSVFGVCTVSYTHLDVYKRQVFLGVIRCPSGSSI